MAIRAPDGANNCNEKPHVFGSVLIFRARGAMFTTNVKYRLDNNDVKSSEEQACRQTSQRTIL